MNTRRHLFTSESVAEGHPDKIADQISDAILDAFLAEEPEAKVACETLVADNLVVIAGEFKTVAQGTVQTRFETAPKRSPARCCATSVTAMPKPASTRIPAKCRCASITSRSRFIKASRWPAETSAPATRA